MQRRMYTCTGKGMEKTHTGWDKMIYAQFNVQYAPKGQVHPITVNT